MEEDEEALLSLFFLDQEIIFISAFRFLIPFSPVEPMQYQDFLIVLLVIDQFVLLQMYYWLIK